MRGRRHAGVSAVIVDASPPMLKSNHDNVPERALVVEEGKVEAVETVIQPAIDAAPALFFADDRAPPRIEIQPRA